MRSTKGSSLHEEAVRGKGERFRGLVPTVSVHKARCAVFRAVSLKSLVERSRNVREKVRTSQGPDPICISKAKTAKNADP